jgi:hypothetical protein
MRTYRSNHRILKLPSLTSTSRIYSLPFYEIQEIMMFKHQSPFFFFFGSFTNYFWIKLNTYGSNLSSRFVNISDVECFVVQEGLQWKFQHHGTYKFILRNSNPSYSYQCCYILEYVVYYCKKNLKLTPKDLSLF